MFAATKSASIQWTPTTIFVATAVAYSSGTGAVTTYTWDDLYNLGVSALGVVNTGSPSPRTVTLNEYVFTIYADGSSTNQGTLTTTSSTIQVIGTGTLIPYDSPPSSGTITYAQVLNRTRGWFIDGISIAS